MGKDLERDLGLPSVIAISMGAMIGSGIFILPGIAMAEAGPAVIVAFIIAAILVVPAGLSIAELGTAMPEAGGDYIYIERGIGPAAGTIAGLGTWLMLMLKGALALFGGMVYLDAVLALPSETAAALIIGTVLIGVNIFGVKQTGQLQTVLVAGMILILVGFIMLTLPTVESGNYEPFFSEGSSGLFTATATVLVSYAGVTKIAAAAEEVENPGRNLPLGLIISLVATTIIYALLVFVLVGIVDAETLAGSNDPMVQAVDPLFGFLGVVLIVAAAMAALISTANAGILTASRYPLALSRDELLPAFFSTVNDRFRTPVTAILVTGGAMLAFIVALDIDEIAKAAGSFQIIVYILVNIALVAFRERDLDWYDPSFTSPLYPWLQIFGVISGVFIITRMDPMPIIGGIVLVIGGLLWYYFYARNNVEREGVAIDVARRRAGQQRVDKTKAVVSDAGVKEVVVAVHPDIDRNREQNLLRLASPLVQQTGRIRIVKFTEVPSQVPLGQVNGQTPEDIDFERYTEEFADELDVEIVASEIVSHDTKHAIVNHAESVDADLLIAERETQGRLDTLLGSDTDWIMEHADCDTVFVQNRGLAKIDEIIIVTDRSPFNDPFKIGFANLIAAQAGATIRCLFAVSEDAPESLVETVEEYHTDLDKLCAVPIESQILRTDTQVDSIVSEAESGDLIMLSSEVHRRVPDLLFPQRADRISALLDKPVVRVHSKFAVRHTFLRPILDLLLFRSGSSPAEKTPEETEIVTESQSRE